MSPFDVAWTMLKSYTSSPATPDGKIVPSFQQQHYDNLMQHYENKGDYFRVMHPTHAEYEGRKIVQRMPKGYDETEISIPVNEHGLEIAPVRMNAPSYSSRLYPPSDMASADDFTNLPFAMQQPRPDTESEKIQLEFVNNPNYKEAYGQEEMLHPSNWYTSNFWQDMESKYPDVSQSEMVVPDDSYFTANA